MNNIEEDFRLFQLVRRKPIKNCIDLTKRLREKRSGIFYFTEAFRIDFENKMCDLERLKTEREQDKARIKELEDENKEIKDTKMNEYLHHNLWLAKYLNELYISRQKVKETIYTIIDYKIPRTTNSGYYYDYFIKQEYKNDFVKLFNKLLEDKYDELER